MVRPESSRRRSASGPVLGRPPLIDREAVAAAAVRVGFDKLSMSAVAAELGVAHPTLYGHVRDRDDLLTLAVETILHDVSRPALSDDWRDYLTRTATAVYAVMVGAPGLTEAVRGRPVAPPSMVSWFGEVVSHLVHLGFGTDEALLAADLVVDLMADAASGARITQIGREELVRVTLAWTRSMPQGLAEKAVAATLGDPADWARRKLDVVLDGVAATLSPRGSRTPP